MQQGPCAKHQQVAMSVYQHDADANADSMKSITHVQGADLDNHP